MTGTPFAPPPEDKPSIWSKFGAALPIALTAIATAFAGMSSSEMARAMFWRSAAAQDQSRAGNQWAFAGFKRDRSLIVQTTAATLRASAGYADGARVPTGTDPVQADYQAWLRGEGLPGAGLPAPPPAVEAVIAMIRDHAPDDTAVAAAGKIPHTEIDAAIRDAETVARKVEDEWDPVAKKLDDVLKLAKKTMPIDPVRRADGAAAMTALAADRFDLDAKRYKDESKMHFGVGFLYEVRVRATTAESDRHRRRSENFFYAMLAAQVGATASSLGLARKQRSIFWTVAGLAGLVAVGFGVYVYLTM